MAAKKKLFMAAEEGDLDDLKAALASGAPIDARNEDGRAALHLAAAAGHTHLVRELLKAGAKPGRRREEDERTALHVAAEEGYVEVVSELLQAGADASAEDIDGNTPLHCAAHYGDVPVLQALLDAGVKVSARNLSGQTPLLVAAEASGCRWIGRGGSDYPAAVAALLRAAGAAAAAASAAAAGADPRDDGSGANSNSIGGAGGDGNSIGGGDTVVCGAGCPVGSLVGCETDSCGETAAHVAVRAGNVEVVAALCAAGAGVTAAGPRGVTPLHMAAAAGQVESVRHLVAAGAPLEAREAEGGLTPFHVAVHSRQLGTAEALIALGADIAAPDCRGLTPLHTAAQLGTPGAPLLKQLLRAAQGRAIRAQSFPPPGGDGSALATGSIGGSGGSADGAPAGVRADDSGTRDPSKSKLSDEEGATARTGLAAFVNASHNDQRITPLHLAAAPPPLAEGQAEACGEGQGLAEAEAVEALLAAGADGVAQDISGRTPLHVAAARGNAAAVRALLAVPGAVDPAVRDALHCTARQLAAAAGHHVVLGLLPPDIA